MKALQIDAGLRKDWLGRCPLFEGLADQDLAALAGLAAGRAYEREEVLIREGDEASGFHLIVDGQVKVSRFAPDGREQVLHLLRQGEPCGEVPAFSGGRYPATASALSDVNTLYLPRDRFMDLARRHPQVLLGMLAVLSRRLRALVELADDLSLKDVSSRLARHLVELSEERDGASRIRLPTTKAVLASRLGTIAETLSRTLSKMQSEGLIRVSGRTLEILDLDGLREAAGR